MTGSGTTGRIQTTRHSITVAAWPDTVFGLIADAERLPCLFPPSVHVERLSPAGVEERLRLWELFDGEVRSWTSRRVLDRGRFRIRFWLEEPPAPLLALGGEWRLERSPGGFTKVVLLHYFRTQGNDRDHIAWVRRAIDRNGDAELTALKHAAELGERFQDLVLSFSDSMVVDTAAEPVYAFLRQADRWPGVLPHVSRLTLQEPVPDVQFLDMDTGEANGAVHTTRWVRICFPHHGIVHKQTEPPPLFASHVGRWTLRPLATGVEVTAHHTVIVRPEMISHALGAGIGLDRAKEEIRRVLGTNSLTTIRHARSLQKHA